MEGKTVSFLAILLLLAGAARCTEPACPLDLALPTGNTALFGGDPANFYQFVDRDFNGVKTTPWEGGQYGFVRNPVQTAEGLVFTHFHEGIDIKPVARDSSGAPIDEVRAIADGTLVYATPLARWSNYGNYAVVEHLWGGCRYYSLYAHLKTITAKPGACLRKGEAIGIMGCTGAGIDQRRAHLHLELNLMLSPDFEAWHTANFPEDVNRHGIYNGLNLAGLDIARLFLALKQNPALTLPEFLSHNEPVFRVAVPGSWKIPLAQLYPWLLAQPGRKSAPSFEIAFDASGLPLKITPRDDTVQGPTLTYVKHSAINPALFTRGMVSGSGGAAHLTAAGLRYIRLVATPQ